MDIFTILNTIYQALKLLADGFKNLIIFIFSIFGINLDPRIINIISIVLVIAVAYSFAKKLPWFILLAIIFIMVVLVVGLF